YAARSTTLLAMWLTQLHPTRLDLGEKPLHHLAAIRRAHADLALPGEIVPCPTIRDPDGLPPDSGTATLTTDARAAALAIPEALFAMQHDVLAGETDADTLVATGRKIIAAHPMVALDDIAIVDPV